VTQKNHWIYFDFKPWFYWYRESNTTCWM